MYVEPLVWPQLWPHQHEQLFCARLAPEHRRTRGRRSRPRLEVVAVDLRGRRAAALERAQVDHGVARHGQVGGGGGELDARVPTVELGQREGRAVVPPPPARHRCQVAHQPAQRRRRRGRRWMGGWVWGEGL